MKQDLKLEFFFLFHRLEKTNKQTNSQNEYIHRIKHDIIMKYENLRKVQCTGLAYLEFRFSYLEKELDIVLTDSCFTCTLERKKGT